MFTTPQDIATPALVIDEAITRRNIQRLAAYAKSHNLQVRPHTKTHKSIALAKAQLAAGAAGLTVAKVGEAEVMASAGDDILLAYPALDPARTGRIAAMAKGKTVRVSIDSITAADALAAAAKVAGSTIGILVDQDIGMHRTGVQTSEEALAIAQHVSRTPGLRLDGLFFYPGHVVAPAAEQPAVLAAIDAILKTTLALWKKHGIEAKIVSGGSTPTAYQSHHVTVQTEIRPGSYIFNDRNYMAGGWVTLDDCAARIIATVVSDAVPGKVVIDAGSKTLTQDRLLGDPERGGFGLVVEYPLARIIRVTEEHGEVDLSAYPKRPKLGTRLQIVPNHICPCVNLQDTAWLRHEDGSVEKMAVDARGKLS
jgi:D-serine deaminase-like pyridoxal phosphate-dependent protein